jgi:3'-5' exonuclease
MCVLICDTLFVTFRQIFPSLNQGGVHGAHVDLPKLTAESLGYETVYIKDFTLANQVCENIINLKPERVGFDLEYTPPDMTVMEGDGKVATIQIAIIDSQVGGKKVFVFHIAQMRRGGKRELPQFLKELLESPTIRKCGVNVASDKTHLEKVGVHMPLESTEDIAKVCKNLGMSEKPLSLNGTVELVLNGSLEKGGLGRSYWDGVSNVAPNQPSLQKPLIDYAATDAAVGLEVALKLTDMTSKLPEGLNPGDHVVLFDSSSTKRIAFGKVSQSDGSTPQGYLLVTVDRVFVKSFKLDSQQKSESHPTITTLGAMQDLVRTHSFVIVWKNRHLRQRILPGGGGPVSQAGSGEALNAQPLENDWRREKVKLDVLHWFCRIGDLLKKSHPLRGLFLRRLRDAVFSVLQVDREAWETARAAKLRREGFNDKAIKSDLWRSYSKMLSRTRRMIPPPEELKAACHQVYDMFGHRVCSQTNQPLFSPAVWEQIKVQDTHIDAGCLSDNPHVDLYYTSSEKNSRLWCARGTSSLEGWHNSLKKVLTSATVSPDTAAKLVVARVVRWNQKMGVSRRGDTEFGTMDIATLLQLKRLDQILAIDKSKYSGLVDPNEFLDTGETFGIIPNGFNINIPDDTLLEENDDDEAPPSLEEDEREFEGDDDADVVQDHASPSHPTTTFRLSEAEKAFNEAMKIEARIALLQPNAPSQDEIALYKQLCLTCVQAGGATVDLNKMQGLWNTEAVANFVRKNPPPRQLRLALRVSLEGLRDHILTRDNQRWSHQPFSAEDRALCEVMRCSLPTVFALLP